MQLDRDVLSQDKVVTSEEYVPTGDKQAEYWQSVKFPVTDIHGKRLLGGIAIDITKERLAQQKSMEQETLLRLILDSIAEAVIVADQSGKFLLLNKAALELHEINDEVVNPQLWPEYMNLYHADEDTLVLPAELPFNQALAGKESDDVEFRLKRPGGDWKWVSASARPLRKLDGSIAGGVVAVRDVTDRKHYEDSLKSARDEAVQANKLKSQFLANISHEIRTPMAGILGMSELLSLNESIKDDAGVLVDNLLMSAKNLLPIVDDLLDFSKLEVGKMSSDKSVFSIQELINSVVVSISPAAQKKGVQIVVSIDEKLPKKMIGNVGRIRQALLNFAQNAAKFTDEGQICISVTHQSNTDNEIEVKFSVKDTGIGISSDWQKQLFQPFVQADGSSTRKHGGTGLGLSIVKKIIELMNGEVGLNSQTGEGSEFWFTVPLLLVESESAVGS